MGLPAPGAAQDSFIDVDASLQPGQSAAQVSQASASRVGGSGAGLPAVRPSGAPATKNREVARPGGGMFAGGSPNLPAIRTGAMGAAAKGLPVLGRMMRKIFTRKKRVDPTLEAQIANPEDRYRICTNCSEEVLATDNFCFSCGQQFKQSPFPQASSQAPAPANGFIYLLAFIGMGIAFLGPKIALPEAFASNLAAAEKIGAVAAPLLTAWAFMRKTDFIGRLAGFVLFILSLAVAFVTFF